MNTEQFIQELVEKAKPVRRILPLKTRGGLMVLVGLVLALLGAAFYGFRPNLFQLFGDKIFLLDLLMLFLLGVTASLAALSLSIPGQERNRPLQILSLVSLTLLIAWTGARVWQLYMQMGPEALNWMPAWKCAWRTFALGIPPAIFLFYLVKRAAVLRGMLVGFLAALSAVAFGSLGLRLACRMDHSLHLLLWHIAPMMVVAFLGILVGQRLIRWIQK